MVAITVVDKTRPFAKRIDHIMESEKRNRNKKIERLLIREAEKTKRAVEACLATPTVETVMKFKKRFSGFKDLKTLEFFYEKDSVLGRAAAMVQQQAAAVTKQGTASFAVPEHKAAP